MPSFIVATDKATLAIITRLLQGGTMTMIFEFYLSKKITSFLKNLIFTAKNI